MSASGPPSDDLPPIHGRTGPRSFAWGESPNVVGDVVGRDHELARVRALLDATREGAMSTLLLEGEPGIGKTTLLKAAERMATGFRCLWVRGVESEISPGLCGAAAGTRSDSEWTGRDTRRTGHRTVLGSRVGTSGGSL